MIKGAFIFAVGASGGLAVGFVSGVLACRSYLQDQGKLSGTPDFRKAAEDVADSLQEQHGDKND